MKRQYLLPDPGEGLLGAEIVAWQVAEVTSSRSTTCWSRSRRRSRWSSSRRRSPAPSGPCWSPRGRWSRWAPRSSRSTTASPSRLLPRPRSPGPNLVGYGASDAPSTRRRRRGRVVEDHGASEALSAAYEPHEPGRRAGKCTRHHRARPGHGRPAAHTRQGAVGSQLVLASDVSSVKAKPPVRKYAADLGVDLSGVVGTGPDGHHHPPRRRGRRRVRYLDEQPKQGRIINDQASFQAFGGATEAQLRGHLLLRLQLRRRVRPDGGVGRLRRGRLPGQGLRPSQGRNERRASPSRACGR